MSNCERWKNSFDRCLQASLSGTSRKPLGSSSLKTSMIDSEKVKTLQNNISAFKASSSDKSDFLRLFVKKTASTLNIYFVGIHFLDKLSECLVFFIGSGWIGERLLKRKHKIKLTEMPHYSTQIIPAANYGEIRLVDWFGRRIFSYSIVNSKISQINLEVISDKYFFSPNYPESHTELYLPICTQGKTIGILELTFNVRSDFSLEEIKVLQLLTDKLAEVLN